jgi:hypothetical protein
LAVFNRQRPTFYDQSFKGNPATREIRRQDTNNGTEDVKGLTVVTPAAIGPQFFRECAEVINAAADGPPDRATMAGILRRHGLTPAPPPPRT